MGITRKDVFKTFTILGLALCALEGCRFLGGLLYLRTNMWIENQEAGVFRWLSWLFHSEWTDILVQYAFVLGLPYLILLFLVRKLPKTAYPKQKLPAKTFLILLTISMGSGYMFNFVGIFINMIASVFSGKPFEEMNPVMDMMSTLTPAMVIYACFLGPFMEELLFRGILLSRARRFGDRTGVVFCAVMFGLMHGNLGQFFYAAAIGLVLGYIAVRTNKLRYNVILHMIINSYSTVVAAVMSLLQKPEWIFFQAFFSLTVLGVMVFVIIGAVTLLVMYGPRGHWQMKMANGYPSPFKKYVWLNPGTILYALICGAQMMFYLLY